MTYKEYLSNLIRKKCVVRETGYGYFLDYTREFQFPHEDAIREVHEDFIIMNGLSGTLIIPFALLSINNEE